jgi:hypothetical protein
MVSWVPAVSIVSKPSPRIPRPIVYFYIALASRQTTHGHHSPDFLWNLVALAHFILLSLTKAAHAAMSSAAWQEIRVRSHGTPGQAR